VWRISEFLWDPYEFTGRGFEAFRPVDESISSGNMKLFRLQDTIKNGTVRGAIACCCPASRVSVVLQGATAWPVTSRAIGEMIPITSLRIGRKTWGMRIKLN